MSLRSHGCVIDAARLPNSVSGTEKTIEIWEKKTLFRFVKLNLQGLLTSYTVYWGFGVVYTTHK